MGSQAGIQTERIGETTVITVTGELDMHSARDLRLELDGVERDGQAVVLDLSHCEFLDSSGLHVLLTARNRLVDIGHELKLASPPENILKVLQLTRVDSLFRIYPSRASALDRDAPLDQNAQDEDPAAA